MRSFVTLLGAAILVAVSTFLAGLLLPACGVLNAVAGSWIDWCPANTQAEAEIRVAALAERNADLERRIAAKERELALYQCRPAPRVVRQQPTVPEIDREGWTARDIGSIEGCWELESKFSTTHTQTGLTSRYTSWRMCFDANGVGREEMRADNGNSCSGVVRGSFAADGSLRIEEPGNLQCSDGGFIYRLSSRCTLDDGGAARCVVTQPELGRSAEVDFRRVTRSE